MVPPAVYVAVGPLAQFERSSAVRVGARCRTRRQKKRGRSVAIGTLIDHG